ncbi:hypothetical protein XI09_00055 [Bradyrhizobium sp. CCBAU 11386]|nr:hypothetical protein [Bradyrhizobium sp. CCBAU 11386]
MLEEAFAQACVRRQAEFTRVLALAVRADCTADGQAAQTEPLAGRLRRARTMLSRNVTIIREDRPVDEQIDRSAGNRCASM